MKTGKAVSKLRTLRRGKAAEPNPPWIVSRLPDDEEEAVLDTLRHIADGTVPSGKQKIKWGTRHDNREGHLPRRPRV